MSNTIVPTQHLFNARLAGLLERHQIKDAGELDRAAAGLIKDLRAEGRADLDAKALLEQVPSHWRTNPGALTQKQLAEDYLASVGVDAKKAGPEMLGRASALLARAEKASSLAELAAMASAGPPEVPAGLLRFEAIAQRFPQLRAEIYSGLAQVVRRPEDLPRAMETYAQACELGKELRYQIPLSLAQAAVVKGVSAADAFAMWKAIDAALPGLRFQIPLGLAHAALIGGRSAEDVVATYKAAEARHSGDMHYRVYQEEAQTALIAGPGQEKRAFAALDEADKTFSAKWAFWVGNGFGQAMAVAKGAVTAEQAAGALARAQAALPNKIDTIPIRLAQVAVANMAGVPKAEIASRLDAEVDALVARYGKHEEAFKGVNDTYFPALYLAASEGAKNPGAEYLATLKPWHFNLWGVLHD